MAISFFDNSNSLRKPFIEDYVSANPQAEGKLFSVVEISKTRKGTGYMLHTNDFSIFLYGESKVAAQLLEALEHYCQHLLGYELIVEVQTKDPFYKLGIDVERPATWAYSKGKYLCSLPSTSGLEKKAAEGNPFILPHTQKALRRGKQNEEA
jgi:hypothetical protein